VKRPKGGKPGSVGQFEIKLEMWLGQRCIMKGGV
jgi:hypothetical protein